VRSPPVDSNELFDIATNFASGEEAVGAIFDGKKGKRVDDAPTEGSKSKEPQQKHKRGKKGKKPCCEAREQGRDDDGDEALAVDPARRGPRPAPRGPGVFDDMLKKPCPYHKTPVNHTLEQCDMLKRFYGRAAAKDGEAKKDGGDGDTGAFPAVENVFLIFGGPTVDMSYSQRKWERHEVLAAEKAPPINRLQHLRDHDGYTHRCPGATVRDSHKGPLNNRGNPLKTCKKRESWINSRT
jgi:hypothetical protein